MSKIKQVIELSSPSLNSKTERIEGSVQTCHYCCGNGWFWGRTDVYEPEKVPCPMCGGSGKLRPVITIEWNNNE